MSVGIKYTPGHHLNLGQILPTKKPIPMYLTFATIETMKKPRSNRCPYRLRGKHRGTHNVNYVSYLHIASKRIYDEECWTKRNLVNDSL